LVDGLLLFKNHFLANHHHHLEQISILSKFKQILAKFAISSSFFVLSLQIDQEFTLAGYPSLSPSYSLCPLVLGHKEGEEPEAIFAKISLLPLSHPLRLRPPIGDELPPRRTPTTPLASHRNPYTSPSLSPSPTPTVRTPVETKASAARQPLLPRHQRPLATVDATQSLPAALTSHRSRRSPCSDRAACTPWMPRACIAFPLVHASTPLAPHTVLHGIERTFTRHTRPARLRLDVSCS
jgi:hypothetical protein